MRDRITSIVFRVLVGEAWLSFDAPDASPDAALAAYRAKAALSCCSFQGGFFVDVNGHPWSDASTVDELRMTMIWFDAMRALLAGAPSFGPGYGPWEQSSLAWTRYGDEVVMADANAGGDRMWGVTVDLPSLALDVAVHGRAFAAWTRALRRFALEPIVETNLPSEDRLASIDALVDTVGVL